MKAKILENSIKKTFFLMGVSLIFVAVIGVADFVIGHEFSFSLFYLFPIVLVTWFLGRNYGLAISFIAAVTWHLADIMSGHIYSLPVIAYWNAIIRFGFFSTVSMLLPALKELEYEKETSRTDHLTGISNRRHFFEILQSQLNLSQRYKRPFTIVYIDLDGFKMVNDTFGHQIGDKVLCAFVNQAKHQLRKTDSIARLGGDEFVLLLPEIDKDEAKETVSRIQSALLGEMQKNQWAVTFSIGVLTYQDGEVTADNLIKQADDLMYSVKQNGKNAITCAIYDGRVIE